MNVANLQRQMKNGAYNFYWIAGLSMANSIYLCFHHQVQFRGWSWGLHSSWIHLPIILLNPFQIPILLVHAIGLLPGCVHLQLCSSCVVFSAVKGYRWAFISGMILYGLDAILTLVSLDFIGFGFHLFFLWFLFSGLQALEKLRKIIPAIRLQPDLTPEYRFNNRITHASSPDLPALSQGSFARDHRSGFRQNFAFARILSRKSPPN